MDFEDETTTRRYLIAALLLIALGASGMCAGPTRSSALAQDTELSPADRRNVLETAQLCVHEATWRGGETADCGGIVQVIRARQESHGLRTYHSALRFTSPRFYASATARAWTRVLRPGHVPSHYAERWTAIYNRTLAFYTGAEPAPCTQEPVRWFGRRVDRARLAAALRTGRWRESDCTETVNAFLHPIDPD